MKRNFLILFAVLALFLGLIPSSQAAYIVDTGEPPYLSQWAVTSEQSLAGQFTLNQAYTITDIEGYFRGDGGTLTMVVYGNTVENTLDLPDMNNELLNGQITVALHPGSNAWYSLSGLDLNLTSGDYWIAFEVRSGNTYAGAVSVEVPDPLEAYVYNQNGEGYEYPGGTFALRIEGNPVPIPGALWLLGSGLIGLAGLRKKYKK